MEHGEQSLIDRLVQEALWRTTKSGRVNAKSKRVSRSSEPERSCRQLSGGCRLAGSFVWLVFEGADSRARHRCSRLRAGRAGSRGLRLRLRWRSWARAGTGRQDGGALSRKYAGAIELSPGPSSADRAQWRTFRGRSEIAKAALPYEFGQPAQAISLNLYSAYVRANANLDQHVPAAASAEFEKILNTPGVGLNEPIAALAHLGMARAYTAAGDNAKARLAYENFLGIWKRADPDIPMLRQAKAEYARVLTAK